MGAQINAQQIIKIYKGDAKVWEDTSSSYLDVKLNGAGQMAVKFDPSNPSVGHLIGVAVIGDFTPANSGKTNVIGTIDTNKKVNGTVTVVSGSDDNMKTVLKIENNVISMVYTISASATLTFFVNLAKGTTDTVTIS